VRAAGYPLLALKLESGTGMPVTRQKSSAQRSGQPASMGMPLIQPVGI